MNIKNVPYKQNKNWVTFGYRQNQNKKLPPDKDKTNGKGQKAKTEKLDSEKKTRTDEQVGSESSTFIQTPTETSINY